MVTCSQCGTESADGQAACSECGGALDPLQAPTGTWGETGASADDDPAGTTAAEEGRDGRQSSPPVLVVHEGGAAEPPTAGGRGRQIGLALAMAEDTIRDGPPEADSTGTRPIMVGRGSDAPGATVVPLRREMIRTPKAATVEDGGAAPDAGGAPDGEEGPVPAEPTPESGSALPEVAPVEAPRADERRAPEEEPPVSAKSIAPAAPPVLASRLLREDLTPTEPGRRTLRILALSIGASGAAIAFGLGGATAATLAIAVTLLLSALLAALPLSYGPRAFGVLGASGLGLVAGGWMGLDVGGSPEVAALAPCTTMLAGGLLFRATYRAAHMGRVLAGVGVLLGGAWLAMTWTYELTSLDIAWQSWLPALLQVAFLFLLLLSLLAFMDASTTAGCRTWGVLVLLWMAVRVPVAMAVRAWPPESAAADSSRGLLTEALATGPALGTPSPEVWAVGIGQVALVILAAVSLSQVLAVAARRRPTPTR